MVERFHAYTSGGWYFILDVKKKERRGWVKYSSHCLLNKKNAHGILKEINDSSNRRKNVLKMLLYVFKCRISNSNV